MFSLHERTQRKICHAVFVFACAVPTLVTLCWVVYFHRPWQERDWQREVESELHVQVTVAAVSAPRPQERILRTVRLADLQSKKPLVEFDELNIAQTATFAAENVTIHCAQVEQLAQVVQIWLAGESFQPAHWQVKRLTLRTTEGITCEIENLRCETLLSTSDSCQCLLQATHAGDKVQLLVERNNEGKVRVKLDAQQTALPAWILAEVVPGASRWQSATFAGVLELEKQNSSVAGEFRGRIQSVDTQAWIGTSNLQTTANLQFDKLNWRDGRFEAIQGSLAGKQGKISNALLLTLNTKLRCPLSVEPPTGAAEQFQHFDQLGCRFQLNAEGLTVSGTFPSETNQWAIALVKDEPLVMQPAFSRLPLAFLIEALCEPADFSMPATRAAADMAEKLPLPESATRKK